MLEVDVSSCAIRVVLSQCHRTPGKLHPCAFYSRKLTTAETNYNVGNRELLAMKESLEGWRHWLEGTRHPFLILTDHRNLEYGGAGGKMTESSPSNMGYVLLQVLVQSYLPPRFYEQQSRHSLKTTSSQKHHYSPRTNSSIHSYPGTDPV